MKLNQNLEVKFTHNNGRTFCIVVLGDKRVVGASKCHENDNFVKKIGRNRAFSRAVKNIESKEDRKYVWQETAKRVKLY